MLWWLQLQNYSIGWWMVFVAIAVIAAAFGRWWTVMIGHCVLAAVVVTLDIHWLETVMSAPDWEGTPDYDLGFSIGLAQRVVLVNMVLLPVSAIVERRAARRRRQFLEQDANISANS